MDLANLDILRPGYRIEGKYEVQEVLGLGGMGVVVAAIHIDLQERVALKFLLPGATVKPDTVERFFREARAIRRLKSEHVVKVLDIDRLPESGLPYMAMELLGGQDLAKILEEQGPLSIAMACDYVLQACDAIGEAHTLGIIHRDIKPANLFAAFDPVHEHTLIKVLDFGIAKILDSDIASGTRTQTVMGSTFYMSPEQMRSTKKVDGRTDIWALGVTLYELLTGRYPFEGAILPELILSIGNDDPVPPRSRREDIPVELEQIILRCLEKSPDARYRTVGDLATALAQFAGLGAIQFAADVRARGSFADLSSIPRIDIGLMMADASGQGAALSVTQAELSIPPAVSSLVASGGRTGNVSLALSTTAEVRAPDEGEHGLSRTKKMLYGGLGVLGVLGIGLMTVVFSGNDSDASSLASSSVGASPATSASSASADSSAAPPQGASSAPASSAPARADEPTDTAKSPPSGSKDKGTSSTPASTSRGATPKGKGPGRGKPNLGTSVD